MRQKAGPATFLALDAGWDRLLTDLRQAEVAGQRSKRRDGPNPDIGV
jgi:hypothetical protein